jgi:addiction module RelB/DinJ family antitoxin
MRTAVINIKTEPELKAQAQALASNLGFSLSSLINGYLRQFTKTKTVYFTAKHEEPSDFLIQALKESEKDRKTGRTSPAFDNTVDAIAWLHDSNRNYGS